MRDNPALYKALAESKSKNKAFLPLFILENYMCAGNPSQQFGLPSRFFISRALPSFAHHFTRFAVLRGVAIKVFESLAQKATITIYVNEDVHPDFYRQVKWLTTYGITVHILKDQLTVERETKTGARDYYSVFTPFKNAVWSQFMLAEEMPLSKPSDAQYPSADFLASLPDAVPCTTEYLTKALGSSRTLLVGTHTIDLDTFTPPPQLETWYTSEKEALLRFAWFLDNGHLTHYKTQRNSLAADTVTEPTHPPQTGATSRMSLALAWGLVSARTLKSEIQKHYHNKLDHLDAIHLPEGPVAYLSELIWREFYKYLYYHYPNLQNEEFQKKFRNTVAWEKDSVALIRFTAWIQGKTGYPIVDAAMEQITTTGWMHNRARMIVASVLTKNLGVDWRWGQEYFRAALIDLDEASNNGGWQWGASVGADPKPIRIFNPELQAENYDTSGAYQRLWLGERVLTPQPIVPHKEARAQALKRYGLKHDSPARDH